jgi:hypothetical protein
MRGQDPRSQQEGNGSRTASSAVHPPPIHAFFSLFSCPDKISQQSHLSRPTGPGASVQANAPSPPKKHNIHGETHDH